MDTFFLPEKQQLAIRGKPFIAASQQVPRARRLVLALLTSLVACAPLATQAAPGMQAEAFQYRQKAVRAAVCVAALVAVVLVTGWL